ncbi:MAG: SCP2 sterol-binding domain-containing protein [Desulfobacterales bacterium]|nr:SCP2 sterol-binding domain-containing protein [Desulfobacterales bacterium]
MSVLCTICSDLGALIQRICQWLVSVLEEIVIVLLLTIMSLAFKLSSEYRRNIEGFNAVYVFKIKKGDIAITVTFKNERMTVRREDAEDFTVKVVIKDMMSLFSYVVGGGGVFDFILDDGLSWEGNLNYLLKFAYMATHLLYTTLEKLKLNRLSLMER